MVTVVEIKLAATLVLDFKTLFSLRSINLIGLVLTNHVGRPLEFVKQT